MCCQPLHVKISTTVDIREATPLQIPGKQHDFRSCCLLTSPRLSPLSFKGEAKVEYYSKAWEEALFLILGAATSTSSGQPLFLSLFQANFAPGVGKRRLKDLVNWTPQGSPLKNLCLLCGICQKGLDKPSKSVIG